jgi:aminopeptidase N
MKPAAKILLGGLLALVGCGAIGACLLAMGWLLSPLWKTAPAIPTANKQQTPSAMPVFTVAAGPSSTAASTPADPGGIGAAGIGDPYFPNMGNGGYDVQHYDLAISVDMQVEEISGTATIEARALQMLTRFDLDFVDFDISSVTVNGAAADYRSADGELVITPVAAVPMDSDFTVAVTYHGRPGGGTETAGIDFLEGWNFYPGGVIVAGEPTGAETWFPSNNHPADKATFDFHITAPKPYLVAANGVLQKTTDHNDGTRTFDWKMADPMATYLSTLAIGEFDLVEGKSPAGRPYRDYIATSIHAALDPGVNALPKAMDYYSEIFGPYPFETAGLVVHKIPLMFSLENQTLIVMGYNFADETVTVHELSHQWYGDSVSVARWKDIWLNEGFASYAEALWTEHTRGAAARDDYVTGWYEYIDSLSSAEAQPIGDPGPDHLFDAEVYLRGGLTLHALRLKVGDAVFFQILQTYFKKFENKNASTEDFITITEGISNQDLGDFFQRWLFETALPEIPELGLHP